MREPLEESYFRWLYRQTGSIRTRKKSQTHWGLLRVLHSIEFVWFVPNDDNRMMDGLQLRHEFLAERDIPESDAAPEWLGLGCSFLEMLVALSRRLSFQAGGEPLDWFWQMMENVELDVFNDADEIPGEYISEKVSEIIFRNYQPDGRGGLFPLESPEQDQTKVEIWYQMSAYLIENS